jgi:hypothetical protein
MGAKLNSAASGGVDYDALADSVWNHGSAAGVAEHLAEVWGRLGLDPSKPLISGQTQISFGDIVMALTGNENQRRLHQRVGKGTRRDSGGSRV